MQEPNPLSTQTLIQSLKQRLLKSPHKAFLILFCAFLFSPLSHAEESEILRLQKWLLEFSSLLESKTDSSAIYLQNYLQCMDDQQALRGSDKMGISELIDNALGSSNECAPLLNDWLAEITDQPPESLSEDEKRALLQDSL